MELATECFKVTASFPKTETYGLSAQLRRAAVSIPSNIAEGHRRSRPGFISHLRIASGSQAEVETQLELARRLGFLTEAESKALEARAETVAKLVHGLLRSLTDSDPTNPQPPIPNPGP
jgi:four helix bundle protein